MRMRGGTDGCGGKVSVVNNYRKLGSGHRDYGDCPIWLDYNLAWAQKLESINKPVKIYRAGNMLDADTNNRVFGGEGPGSGRPVYLDSDPGPAITTYTAREAYEIVLDKVGAWPRDATTTRTIQEVRDSTGGWVMMPPECMIDDGAREWAAQLYPWPYTRYYDYKRDANDWPNPPALPDSDNDGMPDTWEDSLGLKKNDASDCSLDRNGDGYTNIEEYINWLADNLIGGSASVNPQACKNSMNAHRISVHPNPYSGSGLFAIELSSLNGGKVDGVIELYNLSGRKISSIKADHKIMWNGNDYSGKVVSPGIYLVKWKSDGQLIANKKMVVIF